MYFFISHSSKNEEAAEKICGILESNSHRCFLAARDIRAGREYAEEIVNGIDRSDAVIVLLSEAANSSPHVLREVERAVSRKIPIIIYKLEEVKLTKSMEYFLMTHQWMTGSRDGSFENILECVENIAYNKNKEMNDEINNTGDVTNKEVSREINNAKAKADKNPNKKLIAAAIILFAAVISITLAVMSIIFAVKNSNNSQITEDTSKNQHEEAADGSNTGNNENINNTADSSDTDQSNNAVKNDDTENSNSDNTAADTLELGDTVTLGTYLDREISWRVLKISDDGTEAVLVSKDILTMKAFDAAEGGEYNSYDGEDYWKQNSEADTDMELQAKVRGNSDWSLSNIRTWLNSDKEAVSYEGQAPLAKAMSDKKNGYNTEAGFLNGFSKEELSVVKTTTVTTAANALSENDIITTEDKVFLLSRDELKWFEEAEMTTLAKPTEEARNQDATDWYEAYSLDIGMENFYWLLREPVENSASKVYCVGDGYTEENIFEQQAGTEGFGIRPAITVDINKLLHLAD